MVRPVRGSVETLVSPPFRVAPRGVANDPVAGPDRAGPVGSDPVRRHLRPGPRRLPGRRSRCPRGSNNGHRRRRPPDPHRHRRGGDHRGRPGVLHHDRRADPGVDPVRTPHAAELRPRPWHPDHARHLRRHLRLRRPRPGLDLATATEATSCPTCRSRWRSVWCWPRSAC